MIVAYIQHGEGSGPFCTEETIARLTAKQGWRVLFAGKWYKVSKQHIVVNKQQLKVTFEV